MLAIGIIVLAIFIPVGIFLLIKGIRQGDEVDVYNTSGKMYVGVAVAAMIFAVGLSIFCFVKEAELQDNSYYNYNSNYSGNSYSGSSSFTNKYGTSTTKCYIAGCNNYIAKSGDTNCCTTHSNKCGNCYCYIDSDAVYCMSCISGAIGDNNSAGSTTECYICGESAYSKYGSYYYCSDCLALVKAFSD